MNNNNDLKRLTNEQYNNNNNNKHKKHKIDTEAYIEGTNILKLNYNIYLICRNYIKQLHRKNKKERLAELKPLLKINHQKHLLFSNWVIFIKLAYSYINPRLAYEEEAQREEPLFLSDKFFEYRRLFDLLIKPENKTAEKIDSIVHELSWKGEQKVQSRRVQRVIINLNLGFDDFAVLKARINPTRDFILFLRLQRETFDLTDEELKTGVGSWTTDLANHIFYSAGSHICKFNLQEPPHKSHPEYLKHCIILGQRYIVEAEHIVGILKERKNIAHLYHWDRLERTYSDVIFEEYSLSEEE